MGADRCLLRAPQRRSSAAVLLPQLEGTLPTIARGELHYTRHTPSKLVKPGLLTSLCSSCSGSPESFGCCEGVSVCWIREDLAMPPQMLIAAALLIAAAKGVEITRLSMPRWVQNGTEDSVVLDCEYNYSEQDDKRLVVKWFLNDDPQPIYQWIPELGLRAASPRLQGRLNMDYAVSPSSQHTRYRALNIMRPTTDLSGRYSCHVVSMLSQDAEDQVMVVYAPPRSFDFNFTKMSSETVNFTCEADGVFPMPKITLLQLDLEEKSPSLVSGVKTVVHSHSTTGAYHVQVSREIRDRDLVSRDPILFECILSIPGTDYENNKKILYYPGSISGTRCIRPASLLWVVVIIYIACLLS